MHESLETAVSVVVLSNSWFSRGSTYRVVRVIVVDRDGTQTIIDSENMAACAGPDHLASELLGMDGSLNRECYDMGISKYTAKSREVKKADLFRF